MTTLAAREAALSTTVRPGVRIAAVVVCTLGAYSFSLRTLAEGWRYQTPLSEVILVPFLGALLLVAAYRRYPHVVSLRLARADVAIAGVLVAVALPLLLLGPVVWSKYFWASRLDLLTLPLFVAAALTLLFGSRALVRFAFPLCFLLLAWPLPYHAVLERGLDVFTRATTWGATEVALGLGFADRGVDETLVVQHAGTRFTVLIGSACSGINALVGFVIVGAFALYFVRGAAMRRLAWLLVGAALVWFFNILRIVGILAVGRWYGEDAAFRVLHPIAGLVALNAAVLLLVLSLGLFGLRWRRDPVEVDSPLAAPAEPADRATPRRVLVRLVLLVCATAAFSLANDQLPPLARGLSNDGRPALAPFVRSPTVGPDWAARRIETIGWAAPYYGSNSSWVRYRVRPVKNDAGAFTIWLDAVRSPDLGALNAYSLAHCYDFHDFNVNLARRVDLGHGVVGQAFVYDTPRTRWHAVTWEWPVLLGNGGVEHERIVLLASTETQPDGRSADGSGVKGLLLSLLDLRAPNEDSNPALTHAMEAVAAAAVSERVRRSA
jgi:exosortase